MMNIQAGQCDRAGRRYQGFCSTCPLTRSQSRPSPRPGKTWHSRSRPASVKAVLPV